MAGNGSERGVSRRAFLKGGMATLAAAAVPGGARAAGEDRGEGPVATLIDIGRCAGCGACVEACGEANGERYPRVKKPFPKMRPQRAKPEDWSDRRDVDHRLTPYNWLFIQSARVAVDGEETELFIPRRCMHCVNPPCVKLCPWGAARQYPGGTSKIDADICLGGAKCRKACPWHIPQRQSGVGLYLDLLPSMAGNGVMYKCDRCHARMAKGGLPACIEACPEGVQTIGPRDEIVAAAYARAGEIGGYVYGERENGGTNTVYVSPVPFEALDRTIEKGEGRPDLSPKEDVMADAGNLAAAIFLAPVAGTAAALGKYYLSMRKEGENHG